ncbi:MAG: prepilin-type N-terminal cleavage/methylation domain-containing protein [Deltaproteobacteria bacterium]|nr:prepilin-type N-terminal cleavage/methylation domain-containing protein [Deltaproteobacteria bacterium]
MSPEKAYITYTETQTGKLKKEEGFTLIEILIALTIFAVGLLAVAAMQTSAIKVNSTAGKLTNLSTLGMDKIEELSALPYSDPFLDSAGNPHQEVMGDYTISWNVVDNNPVTNTMNITVTVTGRGKRAVIGFIKPNV